MSKINLIFDGNHLFHKSLYIYLQFNGLKKTEAFTDPDNVNSFIRKVATDLFSTIKSVKNIGNIVFTIDSRSWRKDVYIEENQGYKSNRADKEGETEVLDWKRFHELMVDFSEVLKKHGVIISQSPRGEGDDHMHFWSNKWFDADENTLIITGDRDMYQCVKNGDSNWIAIHDTDSKDKKIIGATGFSKKFLTSSDFDFFNSAASYSSTLDHLSDVMKKSRVIEIDVEPFLLEKIITGDSGDGVPPAYSKMAGTRKYILAGKKMEAFKEWLELTYPQWKAIDLFYESDFTMACAKKILEIFKDTTTTPESVSFKLTRNTQLVYLHDSIIPGEIEHWVKNAFELRNYNSNNFNNKALFSWDVIFKGTQYEKAKENTAPQKSNIFKSGGFFGID